jgi:hypothetical protein
MVLKGGGRGPTKVGVVPLSDGTGEVVAIGEGVTRVKIGDQIAGCFHPRWFGGPIKPDYLTEDTLKALRAGVPPRELKNIAPPELMLRVTRADEYQQWTKDLLGTAVRRSTGRPPNELLRQSTMHWAFALPRAVPQLGIAIVGHGALRQREFLSRGVGHAHWLRDLYHGCGLPGTLTRNV